MFSFLLYKCPFLKPNVVLRKVLEGPEIELIPAAFLAIKLNLNNETTSFSSVVFYSGTHIPIIRANNTLVFASFSQA